MKRNKQSTKAMRTRKTESTLGNSRYALKVRGKKQMYGTGKLCCANKLSPFYKSS